MQYAVNEYFGIHHNLKTHQIAVSRCLTAGEIRNIQYSSVNLFTQATLEPTHAKRKHTQKRGCRRNRLSYPRYASEHKAFLCPPTHIGVPTHQSLNPGLIAAGMITVRTTIMTACSPSSKRGPRGPKKGEQMAKRKRKKG